MIPRNEEFLKKYAILKKRISNKRILNELKEMTLDSRYFLALSYTKLSAPPVGIFQMYSLH